MSRNSTKAFVMAVVIVAGHIATPVLAGEWDAGTIDKIVVHNLGFVSVFKAAKLGFPQEDWPNPDSCGNSSKAILSPRQTVGNVEVGMWAYEQAYAALLGAKLNNKKIAVFLDGCVFVGSETFPMIDAVAVAN